MTVNDRIKELRMSQNLTMEQFGERIGIKRSSVSLIESGKNNPSDQTIMLICREFNISEEWLRHGTGDMYIQSDDRLAMYVSEITDGDDDFIKDLIEVYMELDQASKDALKLIADKMAEKRNGRER